MKKVKEWFWEFLLGLLFAAAACGVLGCLFAILSDCDASVKKCHLECEKLYGKNLVGATVVTSHKKWLECSCHTDVPHSKRGVSVDYISVKK